MFAFSLYLNMGFFPAAKARIKDVPRKGTTHSYLSSYSAFSGQYTFILANEPVIVTCVMTLSYTPICTNFSKHNWSISFIPKHI